MCHLPCLAVYWWGELELSGMWDAWAHLSIHGHLMCTGSEQVGSACPYKNSANGMA